MALVGVGVELGEAGAALVRGGEGLGLEDLGELGLDPDRGELARVAADLVDPDRRDHLLDPLAQRRAEVGDVVLVVVDADDLDHHVRADAVGAQPEGEHDVVDVPDRRRAQHDRAAAAQVLLAGLDVELLQRLVDRRGRQVRVEVAALAVVDGAVGEHEQLGALADRLDRLLLEPLDRALRGLGLEQRDVDRLRPAAGKPPRGPRAGRSPARWRSGGRRCRRAAPGRGGRRGSPGSRSRSCRCLPTDPRAAAGGRRRARVEKCSISRSRSIAGLVTTATVSLK